MTKLPYDQPHLSYEKQLDKLTERNVICAPEDREEAINVLRLIGYYRFVHNYLYPFEDKTHPGEKTYRHGTNITDAIKIYDFDRSIRTLSVASLEVLEIRLRTEIAHTLSMRTGRGTGYLDKGNVKASAGVTKRWISKRDDLINRARTEKSRVLKGYEEQYLCEKNDDIPVWHLVDFLDFGALEDLYNMMIVSDRMVVAKAFGVSDHSVFATCLTAMRKMRNACSHYQSLWDRHAEVHISRKPKSGEELPLRENLLGGSKRRDGKLYDALTSLAYLVSSTERSADWVTEVVATVEGFPTVTGVVSKADMGFSSDWYQDNLWGKIWKDEDSPVSLQTIHPKVIDKEDVLSLD